ncbi:hypothetical protein ABZ650_12775 [Streptomyces griseoviridis]|uniref:hypothetical protein n=1 Tax=Streptomyces griseoviridis TaxID=45398 RepID=UPI0033FE4596
MAKRKVRRRAEKILGAEPAALVWCSLPRAIPKPPKEVHRAAGKGPLRKRRHWLFYVGAVVFCFVGAVVLLLDLLESLFDRMLGIKEPDERRTSSGDAEPRPSSSGRAGGGGVFDGDWNLTAGQWLLRWYSQAPSQRRLVLLDGDRVRVAASPRRRLMETRATDFRIIATFTPGEARIEADAAQRRALASFRIRFADGSWLVLGDLDTSKDADHFLNTALSDD